jgi:DNA-binding HxlR family transcriptional regulator
MIKKPLSDPEGCTQDIRSLLDTLDVLGGRWRLLIVHYLLIRPEEQNTFKKMEKDIEGISAKMLSKDLKVLEVNKIVRREVMPTKPITVQYSLTTYGIELRTVIQQLVAWGNKHRWFMAGNVSISTSK